MVAETAPLRHLIAIGETDLLSRPYGHANLVLLLVFRTAQNQPNRRLLVLAAPLVLVEPPKIELHLPLMGGFEAAELEIDGDEARKPAMVEQQIEIVFLAADGHPLLTGDECEVCPEFQQKPLQLAEDRGFQVAFAT